MQLKKVLKKAVYGAKQDSESYVEHLKAIGMKIGDLIQLQGIIHFGV